MVPIIGLKNYSSFVVDYGSSVFGGGGGGDGEDSTKVLGVREFFSILDFTWCNSGSLSKPIQRQLFALYPKVKVIMHLQIICSKSVVYICEEHEDRMGNKKMTTYISVHVFFL